MSEWRNIMGDSFHNMWLRKGLGYSFFPNPSLIVLHFFPNMYSAGMGLFHCLNLFPLIDAHFCAR